MPILNEACYNITIVAIDALGYFASSLVWLYILPPSPPNIAEVPLNTAVMWGEPGVVFRWVIHGGNNWKLWKNNTLVDEGAVMKSEIKLVIKDWQQEDWRPGVYNLTLQVMDESSFKSSTVLIKIYLDLGDPFADFFLTELSYWYLFGEYAIGSPDGRFAIVFFDYSNGHITLDMGIHEEIIDGEGADFTVIAQGGNYTVSVSSSIDTHFTTLGHSSGNHSFDLSLSGLDSVRFVRVEYRSGEDVELDAIEALNFNTPEGDTDVPEVNDIVDFWVWSNQTIIPLIWTAFDATPWSYQVLINDTPVVSESWNGSMVTYIFEPESPGWWNVTLVLFDVFGNYACDTVMIEIRIPTITYTTTTNTTATDTTQIWISVVVFGALGAGAVVLLITRRAKKSG